jgi:hypothetical protein
VALDPVMNNVRITLWLLCSCGSAAEQEGGFQAAREGCLRNWLEAVFSRQSCECDEYRLELRKFLTTN